MEKQLDSRLLSALPYLTPGGVVADIGTDHAYLPIEIIKRGLAQRAVACDINLGPIESARRNIFAAGFSDRIDTLQTDGLHGVETYRPTDVLIFGMGGELIVKILSEASWIQNEGVGLILQPMSHSEILRKWLLKNGFSILGETLTQEEQYYQTIYARFGGTFEEYAEEELYFGKKTLEGDSPLLKDFLEHKEKALLRILEGKRKGSADATLEERLLRAIALCLREKGDRHDG